MSKRTHEKELARARAKRQAERRAARTRRNWILSTLAVVVLAALLVAWAVFIRDSGPDVAIDDDPAATEQPTAGTSPEASPVSAACPPTPDDAPEPDTSLQWDSPPEMQIDPEATYTATMETSCGTIELELFAADAPVTVNNFVFLAREDYYQGVPFHRVIEGFMIQGGDPTGTGSGGPGYTFEDELDTVDKYGFERGNLAMANAGANTNGSQFFIVQGDASHLETHTVFGRVTEGMDVVDDIVVSPDTGNGPVRIIDVTIDGP